MQDDQQKYAAVEAYRATLRTFAASIRPLGATPASGARITRQLLGCGLINCLPLLVLEDGCVVVLRARIGSDAPVVSIADLAAGESMQIAASIETLVPALFVRALAVRRAGEWPSIESATPNGLQALVRLDRDLGGSTRRSDLDCILTDCHIRRAFSEPTDDDTRAKQMIRATSIVAPSDLRSAFQALVLQSKRPSNEAEATSEGLGAWSEPAQIVLAASRQQRDKATRIQAIVRSLELPANEDLEWINGDGVSIKLRQAGDSAHGSLAAAHSLKFEDSNTDIDRCLALIVSCMNKQGSAYDGRAHLRLLKILSDNREYRRAWNFALTAGFWIFKRFRTVPLELTMLQAKIAKDHLPLDAWPIVYNNMQAIGIDTDVLES